MNTSRSDPIKELVEARKLLKEVHELLARSLPIVQYDAQMMADISRHAPLDPETQAKHDSTEYESEKLVRDIPNMLAAIDALLAVP